MPLEVIGVDHVFVAVRNMHAAKGFYNRVMPILSFRRGSGSIGGDPHVDSHVFYHGRQLVYALRPAREGAADHDPYAPGLHHLCFRVVDEEAVDRAARELRGAGVEVPEPRYYPQYGQDYYATFFEDPDRIRLEMMNFRELRRKLMYDWQASADIQRMFHDSQQALEGPRAIPARGLGSLWGPVSPDIVRGEPR